MAREDTPNQTRRTAGARRRVRSANAGGEVTQLLSLDTAALRQRWATLFRANPVPSVGRHFMVRALAYRLQEKQLPGLKSSTLRILDRIADGRELQDSERAPMRRVGAALS